MVELQNAGSDDTEKEKNTLTKIEPVKIQADTSDVRQTEIEDISTEEKIKLEKTLIAATILLLREYGIRKSGAAVRDAVDISYQYVGPKEVVSSLSSLGFKASFGNLNISKLAEEFFPLISFKKNGEAFILSLIHI